MIAFMGSCSVNMSQVSAKYAMDMTQKMQYVFDPRTGLCFGIIASRKSFQTDQSGMGVVCVPCDQVKGYLVNNDKSYIVK